MSAQNEDAAATDANGWQNHPGTRLHGSFGKFDRKNSLHNSNRRKTDDIEKDDNTALVFLSVTLVFALAFALFRGQILQFLLTNLF